MAVIKMRKILKCLLCTMQIERLRKEGSRLVADEQEKLKQQLREESSQLYCDSDTGVRLRVSDFR